ncbi:MAG: (2Fe-2S) ferredoxin domain-containing protein [Eubacteriaceae bacterium]
MKSVHVCIGSACHVNGSYQVIQGINQFIEKNDLKNEIELVGSFCMGKCTEGVAIKYEDKVYSGSVENITEILEEIVGGR